jgi:hypothetical protein
MRGHHEERTALIDDGIERGPDITAVGEKLQHRLLLKQDAEDKQLYRPRAFSENDLIRMSWPELGSECPEKERGTTAAAIFTTAAAIFRAHGSGKAPSSWEFP